MSVRPEQAEADTGEARRQARIVGRSAGSYTGPAAPTRVKAGTTTSGRWVAYGRVGATPILSGFRVCGTQTYGRVGVTPVHDGFRVQGT